MSGLLNSTIFNRVQRVMADIFEMPVEDIQPDSSPDNIESWDSIHHLNFALALEQEFSLQFTPEEIEQLLSAELVTALLKEKQTCEVLDAN